jgi:hypothetical protein
MLGYKPRWFTAEELVPKAIHAKLGDNILHLFDPRILKMADTMRERYGKMLINNWAFGGENEFSGFRPPFCQIGAKFSQHRYGRALDLHPQEAEVADIIHDLQARPDRRCYEHITAVELDVSWLHIDCRNNTKGGILFFRA